MATMAWSWTEVVRFTFYTLKQLEVDELNPLYLIFSYFRYNSFVLLYPLGVGGELISTYSAWEVVRNLDPSEKPFTIAMPN